MVIIIGVYRCGDETREKILALLRDDPRRTIREIAGAIGKSSTVVYYHLCVLEKTGAIIKRRRLARSIEVK